MQLEPQCARDAQFPPWAQRGPGPRPGGERKGLLGSLPQGPQRQQTVLPAQELRTAASRRCRPKWHLPRLAEARGNPRALDQPSGPALPCPALRNAGSAAASGGPVTQKPLLALGKKRRVGIKPERHG